MKREAYHGKYFFGNHIHTCCQVIYFFLANKLQQDHCTKIHISLQGSNEPVLYYMETSPLLIIRVVNRLIKFKVAASLCVCVYVLSVYGIKSIKKK